MTEYTYEDVIAAKSLRRRGFSIRKIATNLEIPKSVIGRWTKNPDKWVQKYQFRDVAKQVKSKEKAKKLIKAKKELLKPKYHERRKKLRVWYEEDTDSYIIGYD